MAYETGVASSPGDLLVKLFDFASANGWTIDQDIATGSESPAWGALHKNNHYISFIWFTSTIKIYPARGFIDSTTEPGSHTNSAYNDTGTREDTGQVVNAITGPYVAYHFFEDDNYIHVVINIDGERYRHFGFGEIVKIGNWSGGEYTYGHYWGQAAHAIDNPIDSSHQAPFDGLGRGFFPPIHGPVKMIMYGQTNSSDVLPGGGINTKWYIENATRFVYADRDGDKLGNLQVNGVRGGINKSILSIGASQLNGFVALCPISLMIIDTTQSPDSLYMMGNIPDVRACNMKALSAGVEYTIGLDTWIPFPCTRLGTTMDDTERSRNWGYAYKKVTT